MKRTARFFSVTVGVVFLFSGFGKALALSDFVDIVTRYGFGGVNFIAPVIVLVEIGVGLLLFFQWQLRKTALIASLLLVLFILTYLYGYIFNGIEECGCFGAISLFELPPALTFTRNAVLLSMLIFVGVHGRGIVTSITKWEGVAMVVVMCVAAFVSGLTYFNNDEIRFGSTRGIYEGKAVQSSPLKNFISTSKDSTYLVFVFTYGCAHCLNAIENLKQYEPSGVVDKVIGLAMAHPERESTFQAVFRPDFHIANYEPQILFELTNRFPTAYYIKNDTVKLELTGELPCSYIFSKQIN